MLLVSNSGLRWSAAWQVSFLSDTPSTAPSNFRWQSELIYYVTLEKVYSTVAVCLAFLFFLFCYWNFRLSSTFHSLFYFAHSFISYCLSILVSPFPLSFDVTISCFLSLCVSPSLYLSFFPISLFPQHSIFSLLLWLSKAVSIITCMQPLTQQAKQWTNTSSAAQCWHAGSQWYRVTGSHGARRLHPTTPSASFRLKFSQLSSYFRGALSLREKCTRAVVSDDRW